MASRWRGRNKRRASVNARRLLASCARRNLTLRETRGCNPCILQSRFVMAATRGELFAGVTVAIVTPFKSGEVDWDDLAKLVDWHCEQSTDALAPCGTTGESPTLTHDENERVVAFVCERARGRTKIMAGTGSNSTAEAIRMTKAANTAGANGTLQVGPYYNKPTQDGYFRHFAAIADATDLPIVVYNIPGRTASNILPETMAKMAEK